MNFENPTQKFSDTDNIDEAREIAGEAERKRMTDQELFNKSREEKEKGNLDEAGKYFKEKEQRDKE